MHGSHKNSPFPAAFETLEDRRLLSTTPTTWGVYDKMIGLDQITANYPKLTGAGESVAIIDSGVDYNHPSLGGGFGKKVIAGYDFENNTSDPFCFNNAHGTAVAGVVAADPYYVNGVRYQGVAPGVKLVALEQDNGWQTKSALDWVIAHRTQYNIVAADITDWTGPSNAYASEIATLTKLGVFIACPSGNGGAGTNVVPNLLGNDFAVGGVDRSGNLWSGSSRGKNLPLVAPAGDVMIPYYQTNDGKHVYYDQGSGTSWAAPNAVGAAALLKQINAGWTPGQIMSILQQSADKVYDGASKLTYDRINVYHAVQLAYSMVGKGSAPSVAAPAPAPAPKPAPVPAPAVKPKTTPVVAPAPVAAAPLLHGHHHAGHHHAGHHHAVAPAVKPAVKPAAVVKPAEAKKTTTVFSVGLIHMMGSYV